ncbi:hypothetical protein B0H11DRAFT_1855347 [Mycena galericulata]|nr:hypothetical protein B0H11DRAFT_2295396 [Mycena galericulata]KAJ7501670.1 hypothetical protein B0H11DRAFT_1855347 [Mycena galericulata]
MPSVRSSARQIAAKISAIAARDDVDSDQEMLDEDVTLVDDDDQQETGGDEEDGGKSSEEDDDEEFEEDDEEVQEDEGAEEEEEVVGKKRKRRSPSVEPVDPPQIEYRVTIFTPEQMKKAKSSRGLPITEIILLASNKPWSSLKSRITNKIREAIDPPFVDLADYTITFTIARHVSSPIILDQSKYDYLVSKALKIKADPCAKILVEPKEECFAADKENDDEAERSKAKGGKKTKVPKPRDILPANVALNEKIGELRQKWICPTPGAACGGSHCFFNAVNPEHFQLSHAHFESWGAAMLKGKEFADLETPPNNHLFDRVAAGARAAKSELLMRRKELQETKNTPAGTHVNFNFPPEIVNLLRPPAPPPAVAHAPNALHPNALISSLRIPGPDLSIDEFCTTYHLDEDVADKFRQHKFRRTSAFKHVELSDLKEMGFLKGEIAELQVAIEVWSRAHE